MYYKCLLLLLLLLLLFIIIIVIIITKAHTLTHIYAKYSDVAKMPYRLYG